MWNAARFDLREVFLQSLGNLPILPLREFVSKFVQSKMNNIVVVDFFRGKFTTEAQPEAVKQIDLLRRQVGCVRTEVEYLFLSIGRKNLKCQARLGVRAFPRRARRSALPQRQAFSRRAQERGSRIGASWQSVKCLPKSRWPRRLPSVYSCPRVRREPAPA